MFFEVIGRPRRSTRCNHSRRRSHSPPRRLHSGGGGIEGGKKGKVRGTAGGIGRIAGESAGGRVEGTAGRLGRQRRQVGQLLRLLRSRLRLLQLLLGRVGVGFAGFKIQKTASFRKGDAQRRQLLRKACILVGSFGPYFSGIEKWRGRWKLIGLGRGGQGIGGGRKGRGCGCRNKQGGSRVARHRRSIASLFRCA